MQNKFNIVLILLALVFFASCDSVYTYEYRVKNITDSIVQVHYHMRKDVHDTTIMLQPGQEQLVCITDHGVESHGGAHFKSVYNDIDSMIVIRHDGVRSKKSFTSDDTWLFNAPSKATGLYNTYIDTTAF